MSNNTEALRAAAQAALDRWDSPQWEWTKHGPTADLMHALRAALAQPAGSDPPVAWHMRVIGCDGSADWCELGADRPEPQPGVEALPLVYFTAQPSPAAQPDGTLHADGYFTWAEGKRPAYLLDKGLPAKFWLAAPTAQPAPAPPGWVLVPVEPTQTMCQEGQWKAQEWPKFPLRIAPIWKAMLAAAPAAMGA